MVKTVLIANRGEVACRIIQAVHELGFRAALVASPQDAGSAAAGLADAVEVFSDRALAQTYLNAGAVIAAAQKLKADLVHPGFGFLSENAEFARAVQKAGLRWIGPDPKSMEKVSNKYAAKTLAQSLKVPTAPWLLLAQKASTKDLTAIAKDIGFPCLVKAAAGGGGKGLKRVECEQDLNDALSSAQREAQNAFNDASVFVERLIDHARHLEIQAFGDAQGEVHTFGERDCSLQRRFQKVIEESPAPHFSDKDRVAAETYARKILKAVDYHNAATVEFLRNAEGELFFMEVNTRLQVEHGVTEERYGMDLVKMQIRTALGETVETAFSPRGHVLELRLYAEDAFFNFLPQPGRLVNLHFPTLKGLRIESGVRSGDDITGDYDPMIAKLLVTDSDRPSAIDKAVHVLRQTQILGPTTNRDFLLDILQSKPFRDGTVTTDYLATSYKPALSKESKRDLAAAIARWSLGLGASGTGHSNSLFQEIAFGRLS